MSFWTYLFGGPAMAMEDVQRGVADEFVSAAGPIQSDVPNARITTPPRQIENAALAVGLGVPNAYPLAINTPLDRAYLRPLQQPLFDTEWYVPGTKVLEFFHRPIKEPFQLVAAKKTKADTNMVWAAQLRYPVEFSILGFAVHIDQTVCEEDRQALIASGLLEFWFGPGRVYLSLPLRLFPAHFFDVEAWEKNKTDKFAAGQTSPGFDKTSQAIDTAVSDNTNKLFELAATILKQANAGQSFHKFNLGRSALKIKPGEQFGIHIVFDEPPKLKSDKIKITVSIVGLKWTPL